MNIVVLGASGILGQHLRLSIPSGITARWYRRKSDWLHQTFDYYSAGTKLDECLANASAVINCAGQSSVDAVQADPADARKVNVDLTGAIAEACRRTDCHYIHVSSNAVLDPVNEYGHQKLAAEGMARTAPRWTVVRPTFLLGIRPLPYIGRKNPAEDMIEQREQRQVHNRWFSPGFARETAKFLWDIATAQPRRDIVHIGWPLRVSRYMIAQAFAQHSQAEVEPVPHELFAGLAPRPHDVAYPPESLHGLFATYEDGIQDCVLRWKERSNPMISISERAREIALFFGIAEYEAERTLSRGFLALHNQVRASWNRANPQTETDILNWYRTTTDYIWELSAYHCDVKYNYPGFCHGVLQRLFDKQVQRVLCLGDGIGDLTWYLRVNGIDAVFHDLAGSQTAAFAQFAYWKRTGEALPCMMTDSFAPHIHGKWDAILAIDFLEHLPNVREWVTAIRGSLNPGGLFVAQNAFGIGSGKHGSIPCHLSINDEFVHTWDDLLKQAGFAQESPQWYRVPA